MLGNVPVDRIRTEARQLRFARTMLTMAAGLLFGVGWLLGRVLGGAWLVVTWVVAAVRVGWREGLHNKRGSH